MIASLGSVTRTVTVVAHQVHEFSTSTSAHHAPATGSALETIIVVVGSLIVAGVVAFTLRYAFRPGEAGADHIKRRVLLDDPEARP